MLLREAFIQLMYVKDLLSYIPGNFLALKGMFQIEITYKILF